MTTEAAFPSIEKVVPDYPPRNKLKTILDIFKRVRNWPDALELRLWQKRKSLRLLEFENGLNVVLRGGSNEWSIIHEFFFAGAYRKALDWLAAYPGADPAVFDLGANIGMFSLFAARAQPRARIYSYEPGPPTVRINRMNMLANPELAQRITLTEAAVAGASGEAHWRFDSDNPGGSCLTHDADPSGGLTRVSLVGFAEAMARVPGEIALVKMDIEGSEWDILAQTPKEAWQRVQALALELHDHHTGQYSQQHYLDRMKDLGFQVEKESVITYFLHR